MTIETLKQRRVRLRCLPRGISGFWLRRVMLKEKTMTDLIETDEAQRINRIWAGLRDEPGYSLDGLTNPLYPRVPKPPERRRDLMRCVHGKAIP